MILPVSRHVLPVYYSHDLEALFSKDPSSYYEDIVLPKRNKEFFSVHGYNVDILTFSIVCA